MTPFSDCCPVKDSIGPIDIAYSVAGAFDAFSRRVEASWAPHLSPAPMKGMRKWMVSTTQAV